ncbi:HEAT repeat domain-containing protein [Halobacterium zhouii]|uniref:HEAT repeat domain-containing protein n=1 Tax=Halobacterium zhouii TaxID=2902624 RepID=UPI003D7907E1
MLVFAFDRDWTDDVNPHLRKEAVPLEWVRHLARRLVRPNACWVLGHLGASTAAAKLDEVQTADSDEGVRTRAQWALSELPMTSKAPAAAKLDEVQTADSDEGVRTRAQWALSELPMTSKAPAAALPAECPSRAPESILSNRLLTHSG